MPGAGSAFRPSSGSSLQGTYDPRPPALVLGSRQTHIATYEQERRSPQEGGRPQAPLSTNANRLPGPYQTIVDSGRSSPLSMGRNAPQSLGMGMPMRPTASEERETDGSFRSKDPFRKTFQPVYPQVERTMSSFSSADAGAGSRPVGLAGTQSTSAYSERSGHPLRPPPYPPGQNQEHKKPHTPYAPPLAFPSGQMSSPDQNNAKYRSGPRSFPDPLSAGTSSDLESKTASAGSFVGFKDDRPSPTRLSRLISEEKLIASFVKAEAQKSLKNVRSKSRTPGRKAEGEELLRAIEAFDALLFSDTKVGTMKADHKK
ncbi:hypothetical protein HPB51_019246 [Rhipicephalus microplus]|uniref:Uncharacterized protein n=1 Tax=Rhipicephalus microplus TaxID=6941 RepID=A0A9J6F5J9_RHIMP|nr:hypothetical protein HPB51_019246 [Rhipicephalus microplus]